MLDLCIWGEPHITGTVVHELYIYIYMVHWSHEIYAQHGPMGISMIQKYSIAHSHSWATGRM